MVFSAFLSLKILPRRIYQIEGFYSMKPGKPDSRFSKEEIEEIDK
jgi:hypothetical protein